MYQGAKLLHPVTFIKFTSYHYVVVEYSLSRILSCFQGSNVIGYSCFLFFCRSHDSTGPYTRDSREREFERDERAERPDRPERPDERRGDGEYDGPAGMQPEGIIEVRLVWGLLLVNLCYINGC